MADALEWGRAVLDAQPFSRLMGCEISQVDGTNVEITLDIRDDLKQHHGFVHGGVLSFLADMSLTFAGALAFRDSVLTAEFKINFLRPGIGQKLIARSSVVNASKSQAVTTCNIFVVNDGTEKLCATALGTIANRGNKIA